MGEAYTDCLSFVPDGNLKVSGPTNGSLSGTAPNITYTPTIGSAGADGFLFRVPNALSAEAL